MTLLIDGYNLLHATDLFGEGALAGTLQGSREALLRFLASSLSGAQRRRTTIVFDAAGAPPGLPAEAALEGMRVLYARDFADADAMLEALIERSEAPKELVVVSGDRRVQRAARRRGAKWRDSAQWLQSLRPTRAGAQEAAEKPVEHVDMPPAEYWVDRFSQPDGTPSPGKAPPDETPAPRQPAESEAVEDPFPPGYADDVAREFEDGDDAR